MAIPKLLEDAINYNEFDIDIVTKRLKIPWLKLDIKAPTMTKEYLDNLRQQATDLRTQWRFKKLNESNYQVKDWDSQLFFGPKPFNTFLDKVAEFENFDFSKFDSDSKTRYFRDKHPYDWHVEENEPLRQWISSFIPDEDLNLVYSYWAPPGGYVFPHRDYAHDGMGLNKLYVAVAWPPGNLFGMYGVGNVPINESDVFLINNYTLPHWVHNTGNEDRLVISISANLKSPKVLELIQKSFTNTFLR